MITTKISMIIIFLVGLQIHKIFAEETGKNESATVSSHPTMESNFPIYQRIITNLEIIYGHHGVPVQMDSYNETKKEADNLPSVPGCPKSIDGYPWIYYGEPARCFLADQIGPCPLGEKLMSEIGFSYGTCACECLADDKNKEKLLKRPDRYLHCQDSTYEAAPYGQIYDKQEKKCYNTFQEGSASGPCKNGTVIASWTGSSLKCLPLCDYNQDNVWELLDKGLCDTPLGIGSTSNLLPDGILRFDECGNGQKFSDILKKCVKSQSEIASVLG